MSGPEGQGFNRDRLPASIFDVNGQPIKQDKGIETQEGRSSRSAANDLVQDRGMEGAQADELTWRGGNGD